MVIDIVEGEVHVADLVEVRVRVLYEEAVGVLGGREDQLGGLKEGFDRLFIPMVLLVSLAPNVTKV